MTITTNTLTDALKAQGLSEAQIAQVLRWNASAGSQKKSPKLCRCGCGEWTKGGVYRPGHDAKHLSAVMRGVAAAPVAPEVDEPVKKTRKPKASGGGTRVDVTTGTVTEVIPETVVE